MNLTALESQATLARESGFEAAAVEIEARVTLARKLAVAYEHYRYVPAASVQEFNLRLTSTTTRKPSNEEAHIALIRAGMASMLAYGSAQSWIKEVCDQLVFTPLASYPGLPPTDVMESVKVAKSMGVFDVLEVAHIAPAATKIVLPDPIVFGRIDGCTDRFFIAEWGTDVSISDLIGASQG